MAAAVFTIRLVLFLLPLTVSGDESACERAWSCGVNLHRYPVHDLSTPVARRLLSNARKQLERDGIVSFEGFLHPAALKSAAADARRAAPSAYTTDAEHNAYQLPETTDRTPSHVRNLPMRTRVASTAYDELGDDSALRRLYEWEGLLAFIGAVTGRPIHRLADPLGCCSVNVFRPGMYHAWHFDQAEFTTTLCLQPAEAGGDFEFTSPLRGSDRELAAPRVAHVIRTTTEYTPSAGAGERASSEPREVQSPPVQVACFRAGTLQIFNGQRSLHRVTRVDGSCDRLVAVLCFASAPGVVNTPEVQHMFWGRTSS